MFGSPAIATTPAPVVRSRAWPAPGDFFLVLVFGFDVTRDKPCEPTGSLSGGDSLTLDATKPISTLTKGIFDV
jgi:hypothetical protein